MANLIRTLAVAAAVAIGLHAQIFEAVSIKLHPEPISMSRSDVSGTYATWTAGTLLDLIVGAWNLKYYQVPDAPNWVRSDHFDIRARAPGGAPLTDESLRPLVQAMVADRFQLKVHLETRDMPVYALVIGKSGSKLKDPDMNSREGYMMGNSAGIHMVASHATMQHLAEQLSSTAGRPVVDKTGLTGVFAYKLDFKPDSAAVPTDSDLPPMSTAVQEQLGLRLEPQKAPIEILVIDKAEKPSEN